MSLRVTASLCCKQLTNENARKLQGIRMLVSGVRAENRGIEGAYLSFTLPSLPGMLLFTSVLFVT